MAVADKNGIVQEKLSYDAWGKRRNINGTAISLSVLNAFKPKFSQKGFTNHKHVDSVSLIHMNGRMYDPIVARFLSADPIIQSPSNLQSVNRYSYVMNNPLSFVDPSGYWSLKKWWKKHAREILAKVAFGISGHSSTVRNAMNAGICIYAPQLCGIATATNAYVSGARTEDAIKAGARAQVGVYVGQKISGYVGNAYKAGTIGNIIGNGISGGIQSEINGGSFGDGFISSAAGAAFKPINFNYFNAADQVFQRVAAAAFVGGLASMATGGKFGWGAFSAGFSQYWNGERSFRSEEIKREILKDGKLTLEEARLYWREGDGSPLSVDLNKIDLHNITVSDFPGGVGSRQAINLQSIENFSKDGVVYGSLTFTLVSSSTVMVLRPDTYDFDIRQPFYNEFFRNTATFLGEVYSGSNGTPYQINFSGSVPINP